MFLTFQQIRIKAQYPYMKKLAIIKILLKTILIMILYFIKLKTLYMRSFLIFVMEYIKEGLKFTFIY